MSGISEISLYIGKYIRNRFYLISLLFTLFMVFFSILVNSFIYSSENSSFFHGFKANLWTISLSIILLLPFAVSDGCRMSKKSLLYQDSFQVLILNYRIASNKIHYAFFKLFSFCLRANVQKENVRTNNPERHYKTLNYCICIFVFSLMISTSFVFHILSIEFVLLLIVANRFSLLKPLIIQ